jgi:hypothetical protein
VISWTDITGLLILFFAVMVVAIGINMFWKNFIDKNPIEAFVYRTKYDFQFKQQFIVLGFATILLSIALFIFQGQFGLGKYFEFIFGILALAYAFTLQPAGAILIKKNTLEFSGFNRKIPLADIEDFEVEAEKITFKLATHNVYLRECELREEDIKKLKSFLDAAIK